MSMLDTEASGMEIGWSMDELAVRIDTGTEGKEDMIRRGGKVGVGTGKVIRGA